MKNIIIFYASYGGGHLSAAKSIKQYLEENYSNIHLEMIDCMKYINKTVEKLTTGAYREMAKKAPKLWGRVYSGSEKGLLSKISKDSNKLMAHKLYKLLEEFNPDLVISTHPFSSQMVSYLKKKRKLNCKLVTIMTDFAMHKQWLIGHEYTEHFFVSNEAMKQDIIAYGVDGSKVHVTGIPMSHKFLEKFNSSKVYEDFKLNPDKKVILFFGGGEFGLGKDRTTAVLRAIIEKVPNYQIVAVAGKNVKMKESFEQLVFECRAENRVRVLGFTDKVPELMSIACSVVSKPGGLTTTESLASSIPMLIINPIPRSRRGKCRVFREKWGWYLA
ncbi:MAG: hypothetical protein HFJ28_05965 [Clostridia bacterium]|nr:hypothetical protein [Clostridia bacterium]